MAEITLKGSPIHTLGRLPAKGTKVPEFTLVKNDLSEAKLADYKGKNVVLNIFPSLDTPTCAASVRRFNEEASKLADTVVLCVSKDLPFAQSRFCVAEGLDNVETLSDFRDENFGDSYQTEIVDGPLAGLESRVVVVLDKEGKVMYTQQVPEIVEEPDYDAALAVLR